MRREISDKTILDKFVEDFVEVIERHCRYIIVSGFIAIAHGRSRGTEDIDMIIEKLSLEDFTNFHNDLLKHGFECMPSKDPKIIYDYLIDDTSVRYVRKGEFLPEMEIKFAKDELDYYQLDTRVKLPLTGLDVWFSSVEGSIAFKEEYLKADKDLEDAKHLRIVYEGKFSEEEIEKIKKDIRRIKDNGKR
tara:strand:- start:297 stop:866 length:570 start_codon:yes stop_codon:yes gene_type:complete